MVRNSEQSTKPSVPRARRSSLPERNSLRSVMPNVGMKYESERRLMHDIRRDNRVSDALGSVGCDLTRRSVTHAFADMFRVAAPIVSSKRATGMDLWDILPHVQREINWAKKLPEAVFFELFTSWIEARHEWRRTRNPNSPPRARDNDRFIYQIDAFRRAVGDHCPKEANSNGGEHSSWILVDAVFFNELAGGLDVEEDEEEEEGDDAGVPDVVPVVAAKGKGKKKVNGSDGGVKPQKGKAAPAKRSTPPTPTPTKTTKRKQKADVPNEPRKKLKR